MSKHSNTPKKSLNTLIQTLATNRVWQFLLIFLLILVAYSHTLDVPFYYDDNSSLRNNPAIQGLHFDRLWAQYSARFIGYFTFALNYTIHGYNVGGYHLFNIVIHLLNAFLVFQLASLLLRTPMLSSNADDHLKKWLPFSAAILFALHPLQIQAVTYIVQRLASMAAFFYLASITAYLGFRLAEKNLSRCLFAGMAVGTFILGFLTKQNVLTAPLIWALLEIVCFPVTRIKLAAAAAAALVLPVLGFLLAPLLVGQPLLEFVDTQTRETTLFSRLDYFLVQMHVLLDYLIKFAVPLNLTLNYEYSVPAAISDVPTLFKTVTHAALIIFAAASIRKIPWIAFGILFYYIAHLVESSFIPIRDFGFDHRTYIPNTGLCLAIGWLFLTLSDRYFYRYKFQTAILLVILLTMVTWQRNNLWRDPIAFFNHEAKVLDDSFRVHCILGQAYYEVGDTSNALETYR